MNEHSQIYDMRLNFFASTIFSTITAYSDRKKIIGKMEIHLSENIVGERTKRERRIVLTREREINNL